MDSNGTATIIYETLGSFSFSFSFSHDPEPSNPNPNTSPDLDPSEPYAVFRNAITSSLDVSADIPVADYFSLDVSADSQEPPSPSVPTVPRPDNDVSNGNGNGNHAPSERAWFRAGSKFKSPMIQLHKEIIDFCEFVSPTAEEQAKRNAAVEAVTEVVKYIWPHCKVEVFGSFRTGLYLPTSDIDVVILESNVRTPQMGLYALSRALSQRNVAKKVLVIAKARVPIIKFEEKRSGIAFDISFDIDGGPKAADFIKGAVQKLPPLRPLCMILKVFLQQRELNEVYSGGVGSYTLLAMLIAHLQIHWRGQHMQGGKQSMEHNLGILLIKFFDFYGRKLNTSDVGISCHLAGTFFLKNDKGFVNSERPNLLSIEDPQAPDNDIGRSSFNFFKVRSAFSMAYSLLTDAKAIISLGSHKSILGTIIRPDPILLNRKGGENGQLTFDSLLPGADNPISQQFGNENSDIYNWQLLEEEPLPREKILGDDDGLPSSQKRKANKSKHKSRKPDDDTGETSKKRSKEGSSKKKRRKAFRADEDGFGSKSLPQNWRYSR